MAQPFEVAIPQAKIDAIMDRVRAFPWFPAPADEGDGWERGTNTAFLRRLCEYWLERYDWRRAEAELNRFPQFVETVDGQDIHFVHVVGEAGGRRPAILSHGWPGSHYEFWESIEKLAFPSRFGGSSADAFDLVVPSLPGYGFSGKPASLIGQRRTAELWNRLMTDKLGYPRYLAQGGDWGSFVTSYLGLDHQACAGIHINMVPFAKPGAVPETPEEKAWMADLVGLRATETAYAQQQSTKPQTLAMALMDSPVGTAAWIIEKFHRWSDLSRRDIEEVYGLDRLITNVMIYLVTDSIATSVWYYRARLEQNVALAPGDFVSKPTGVADFAGEMFKAPPRSWAERCYNITHWTSLAEGGHFAAMERPAEFVEDFRKFASGIGF